jgi:hypothetical protein
MTSVFLGSFRSFYDDLRMRARRLLSRELGYRTIRPTSLVDEAYIKLSKGAPLHAGDSIAMTPVNSCSTPGREPTRSSTPCVSVIFRIEDG